MAEKNKNKLLYLLLIGSMIGAYFFILPDNGQAQETVGTLNEKITEKRNEIDMIQKEIDTYAKQIQDKQREARGLQNQIAILENQIAKVNLDIEATQGRIEQTNLEIQSLNLQIQELEQNIEEQKNRIAEYLRLINRTDQVSYMEILLVHNTFSEFFDQIKLIQNIHSNLKTNLDKLKTLIQDLKIQKSNWQAKAELEENLKSELQNQRAELEERTIAQELLFVQARLTERQYQQYSRQLQLEQQQANADILNLERKVRKQLEERERAERFQDFGPARLSWPVSPTRGITAFFHDPDYPFRYLFEHPAIDIRAYQGTPIQAPESGYVARVKYVGDSSYAYVMLIHNDGISTVYGHISKVLVGEDEYVSKGQTIALTGGTPGTTGAGALSTGPHLHFEVRLNGIPVNPLEYLPPF